MSSFLSRRRVLATGAGAARVDLEVSDDGVGFDPAEVFARTPHGAGRGFGLPAARARLREYGGDLGVCGEPGRGTRIRATVSARPRPQPAAAPVPTATAG